MKSLVLFLSLSLPCCGQILAPIMQGPSTPSITAPTIVNKVCNQGSGLSVSVSITPSASGHDLYVSAIEGGVSSMTIADTNGTPSTVASLTFNGGSGSSYIAKELNAATGAHSISMNSASGFNYANICVLEVSGSSGTGNNGSNSGSGSGVHSCGSLTTTQANSVVFAGLYQFDGSIANLIAGTSLSFTLYQTGGQTFGGIEYGTAATAQAYTLSNGFSENPSSTNAWVCQTVEIKGQ